MKPLTVQKIKSAIGARALSVLGSDGPMIQCVCTDSRAIKPGSLFIALRGEKHDGHQHLAAAAAAGAVAALVEEIPANPPPNLALLQSPNTRRAMGRFARYVREQMHCKVIAVAGSNGKTGTKHLIASAIGDALRGSIAPKSFNNDIGVPLTIFPADPLQDFLVLEMGTNHPGEIETLSEMARPDIAVITNCAEEHLEGLGSVAGVRKENAAITKGLNPRGCLIVNGDDPALLDAVSQYPGKRITFGLGKQNDLYAHDIRCTADGVTFKMNDRERDLFIPLLGEHNAVNALAAIAVARRLGVDEQAVFENLTHAAGPEMRLQLQQAGDVTILNDAYNANPASMRAALETLCRIETKGRRIAVAGDMRELGQTSEKYHREVGAFVATLPIDRVFCVGEQAALIAQAAKESGMDGSKIAHWCDNAEAAGAVPEQLQAGDLVLLKASRGIHLETVATAIQNHWAGNLSRQR